MHRMPPRCGGSGRMRGTASTARRWKRCWIRRRCNGLNCIRAVGQLLAATRAEAGGPRYYADFAWRRWTRPRRMNGWTAWMARPTKRAAQPRRGVAACAPARCDAGGVAPGLRRTADMDQEAWMDLLGYALEEGGLRPLHDSRPLHLRQRRAASHGRLATGVAARDPRAASDLEALRRPRQGRHGGSWRAWAAHCRVLAACVTARCTACCRSTSRRAPASPATARSASASACPVWAGRSRLFYRHDAEGLPQAHPTQRKDVAIEPQFPAEPLASAEVTLFEAPARWAWQDWGDSNGQQNLSRVGGAPSWVQQAWYPPCPDCGHKMSFASSWTRPAAGRRQRMDVGQRRLQPVSGARIAASADISGSAPSPPSRGDARKKSTPGRMAPAIRAGGRCILAVVRRLRQAVQAHPNRRPAPIPRRAASRIDRRQACY